MAEDLEKKMEPEISEAVDKAQEIIEEKAAKEAEELAKETAEAVKDAAETVAEATAVAAISSKEAEAAAKAAKKAEAQAAKDAAKAEAKAQKDAEKLKAAQAKADAKIEKKKQKIAAQQALLDACPPQYRPVSTSKYFWLAFLSAIPVIGFIATLILSVAGRNRNIKNFERAILAYYIIAFVICLIAIIVIGICLPAGTRDSLLLGFSTIFNSISFG